MASICKEKNGGRRIKFYDVDGKQRGIRLGKVDQKTAERICRDVEELIVARRTSQPLHPATAERLGRLSDGFRDRFVKAGLLQASERVARQTPLLAFVEAYIRGRTDVKESTKKNNYRHAKLVLVEYFGADRLIDTITPGDAEDFRIWLQTSRKAQHKPTLASNTVRRLCARAKQFFANALKKRLIDENPFAGMKGLHVRGNGDRRRLIPREWIDRVSAACPNEDWRLLVALCRYGGMRPSEACNLRWQHIDWEHRRIHVPCGKTEHHEGRAWREIPFFPELAPLLQQSWEHAEDGAEMVIARYRSNRNLRTRFEAIVKCAGLEMWPKPFQNLRVTRQNELRMQGFAEHVVCGWIGNTQEVAREHYLTATDEDYRRATEGFGQACAATAQTVVAAPLSQQGSRGGPKSGPAVSASSRTERNGAKSSQRVKAENSGAGAGFLSDPLRSASAEERQNSPTRIRT